MHHNNNMVDPYNITNYNRTQDELEELILFCACVAGKTAYIQAKHLETFLSYKSDGSPFQKINLMLEEGSLLDNLQSSKIGQYKKLLTTFSQLAKSGIDLKTCSTDELEAFHGIGPKTSRFFIVHTRPNQNYAILDTHILNFIRQEFGIDVPKSTPSTIKMYLNIEKIFLDYVKRSNRDMAEFDLEIWKNQSRKNKEVYANE